MSDDEESSPETPFVVPGVSDEDGGEEEEEDDHRKLRTVYFITWLDTVQACFLLAYYGQMYRVYDSMIWTKREYSIWDERRILEGATWFGIFMVHTLQLLAAINLCSGTKQPGTENLRERCQSWYAASKILVKFLVIECFILFMPHNKPYIFNWYVFTIKAVFRLVAIRIVFSFMEDLRQRQLTNLTAITTFLQQNGSLGVTSNGGGVNGDQFCPTVNVLGGGGGSSSTSLYIGAGLQFGDPCSSSSSTDHSSTNQHNNNNISNGHGHCPDDEPPPPYSEAIRQQSTSKKDHSVLYLHV